METLRWGLLSTAKINRALIRPLKRSKRNQLVAVASRSLDKAETYAREWKIPRAFGSYEALLADPEINVIYNSLPNALHAEWTIKAAQAGKHVLCEKPLALSVAEVDAITAAAEAAGVVVAEAFMYRHHPQTIKVKELVASGAVGKLQLIRGAFTYQLANSKNVRLVPDLGGGSIWDVGCYPINYARYLAGAEPVQVMGWQVPATSGPGVDLRFTGQMVFPGEVFSQFDSSFETYPRSFIEVVGSEGRLEVREPYKPRRYERILLQRGKGVEKIRIHSQGLYQGEVEDIAAAVLDGQAPRISLADSRGNVAALVAFIEAARLNQPVTLL